MKSVSPRLVRRRPPAAHDAAAPSARRNEPGLGSANLLALVGILLIAAAARWVLAFALPRSIYPDEIFQVLEPAHRLVYGNGVLPWEYIVGLRNWLFPGAVAAAMWVGRLAGTDPTAEMIPVRLLMIAASLIPVATAYRWGERVRGLQGGVITGGFVAVWVDLVYMAPHTLSDVIASDVLMAGLYAALPLTTQAGGRRLVIAGALFGLVAMLRLQLAPALLVAAIFGCGRSLRGWLALALGGAVVVLGCGLLDWVTLGAPFRSVWLNLWLNIFEGVSNEYGVDGPAFFVLAMLGFWGLGGAVVLFEFVMGARRFPALGAVVMTILVTQSAIAHKEWRFFFPALAPIVTLCGLAASEQLDDLKQWLGLRAPPAALLSAGALVLWASLAILVGSGAGYRFLWTNKRDLIQAFALAAREPAPCGLDIVDDPWWRTPGSAALPPGEPLYTTTSADMPRYSASFNQAVAPASAPPLPAPYRRVACFNGAEGLDERPAGGTCLWIRRGGCSRNLISTPQVNWPPYFRDERGRPLMDRINAYRAPNG